MLISLKQFNTSLFNYARDTFESGVADALDTKECISALFHEDTEEFYIDYDLLKSEMTAY